MNDDVIRIKVDGEEIHRLLSTSDDKDRVAVVDQIRYLSDAIGAKMTEANYMEFRRYASLPALQTLLLSIVDKNADLADLASKMLMVDILIVKHNYEEEEKDLSAVEPTKAN